MGTSNKYFISEGMPKKHQHFPCKAFVSFATLYYQRVTAQIITVMGNNLSPESAIVRPSK